MLSSVEAEQALQIWISAANRGLRGKLRKLKIWLLTGIYLLKDASVSYKNERIWGTLTRISSTMMAALSGTAIGPAVDLESSTAKSSRTPTRGWLVWAAQYHAIDYETGRSYGDSSKRCRIKLLYDIVSEGTCYAVAPDWATGISIWVTEEEELKARSGSVGDMARSNLDEDSYKLIEDNFVECKMSQWLREDSLKIPPQLSLEQATKKAEWETADLATKDAAALYSIFQTFTGGFSGVIIGTILLYRWRRAMKK